MQNQQSNRDWKNELKYMARVHEFMLLYRLNEKITLNPSPSTKWQKKVRKTFHSSSCMSKNKWIKRSVLSTEELHNLLCLVWHPPTIFSSNQTPPVDRTFYLFSLLTGDWLNTSPLYHTDNVFYPPNRADWPDDYDANPHVIAAARSSLLPFNMPFTISTSSKPHHRGFASHHGCPYVTSVTDIRGHV